MKKIFCFLFSRIQSANLLAVCLLSTPIQSVHHCGPLTATNKQKIHSGFPICRNLECEIWSSGVAIHHFNPFFVVVAVVCFVFKVD